MSTLGAQTSNTTSNSDSLLIPGYLLVKSNDTTYELQQTFMAINMDTNINFGANIQLSAVVSNDINKCSVIKMTTPSETSATAHPIIASTGDVNGDNYQLEYSAVVTHGIKDCNNNLCVNGNDNRNDTTCHQNVITISDKAHKKLQRNCRKSGESGKSGLPPSRLAIVNCPVCNKQFKKTYLKEHQKMHEQHKPYKCVICGKTYRWRTLLRNHKKTHLAVNPFTCPVCELRMSSKFSVEQHILKVHENAEKKYSCDKCSKCYVTTHQLKAHQKFHSSDRTRQCEYCGRIYKHMASLERHRRAHNKEENSLDLRLKCFVCGLICHSKTHYTAHQRIHTGEKPFVCEMCGKCYRQIAQLNQHKIVHTDLRPFSCTLCERTFRCRSNLQLHIDHHKGEKRHTCNDCGQQFYSYPNMLKHVRRNHLGLRPFKCDLCDNKRFCEKQELQNHMRTHTGEKRPLPKRKRIPLPALAYNESVDESGASKSQTIS